MQTFHSELRIEDIRHRRRGKTSRISAQVGDRVLWFESDDVELAPGPEVFASALLIPALNSNLTLVLDQPLSSTWLTNCRQLLHIYRNWWSYAENVPTAPAAIAKPETGSLKTSLSFTGGVDSFYSLLRSGLEIDYLVNIHGFVDTPLKEGQRLRAISRSVREVAERTGKTAVIVRTNFLELPVIATTEWERVHGSGLMAVGHAMANVSARHLISSSHNRDSEKPWGSHWMTDHLWSSETVQMMNVGAEMHRAEKLRTMALEPLLHEHLHVCWQNLTPEGNCSRCDKCLRTRATLLDCDALHHYTAFTGVETLARDLDSLPAGHGEMKAFRRVLASGKVDRKVVRAIENLVERTENPAKVGDTRRPSAGRRVWSLLHRLAR